MKKNGEIPYGWIFISGSLLAHYFQDRPSLCGRWGLLGDVEKLGDNSSVIVDRFKCKTCNSRKTNSEKRKIMKPDPIPETVDIIQPKEGWIVSINKKNVHYFRNNVSLCGTRHLVRLHAGNIVQEYNTSDKRTCKNCLNVLTDSLPTDTAMQEVIVEADKETGSEAVG